MPGLLYYIPDRSHAKLADLAELGLQYAFEQDLSPRRVTGAGPDGGQGVVIADGSRVPDIGYYRDRQDWMEIPGSPVAGWVGRYADQPVRPEDLARLEMLPGHPVRLGDRQEWQAPIARAWWRDEEGLRWYEALPHRTGLDDQNRWNRAEVAVRYRRLWEIAVAYWDEFWRAAGSAEPVEGGCRIEFDFQGLADSALVVLAANYRLDRAEVAFLGLYEESTPQDILNATIDWPTYVEEEVKKKQPSKTSPAAGD